MIPKELKYVNGHFYEVGSGDRVTLKDNIIVTLDTDERNFIPSRPAGNKPEIILSREEKKYQVENDEKVKRSKKIFNAGKLLYFYIPLKDAWFKVELLEDLYVFLTNKSKKKEGKLYPCACVVVENPNRTVPFFEKVYATSLNELYKSTYVHYYGNIGNPASNALARFLEKAGDENSSLMNHRLIE